MMMRKASHAMAGRHARLREVALFSECTDDELETIDGLLATVRVRAGDVLVRERAVPRQFMVIEQGFVSVTRDGEQVSVLGPGSFFGEMALLGQERRSATVTAVTNLMVDVLNPAEFDAVVAASPSIGDKIHRAASARETANAEAHPVSAHA